jgi:hypothetical protein
METSEISGIFQQIMVHNSRAEEVLKSKIKLSLPSMISDLMYKFQIIF